MKTVPRDRSGSPEAGGLGLAKRARLDWGRSPHRGLGWSRRRLAFGALIGLGLVASLFTACAKGNTSDAGGVGGGTGGRTPAGSEASSGMGGSVPMGGIGSVCSTDADCAMGKCIFVGSDKYCSTDCPPDCPAGTYCSIVSGKGMCVPDLDQECTKCMVAKDCKLATDECLKAPLGDTFCARDCTPLGTCPNGFTCVDKVTYAGGGGADGGAPDSGTDGGKPPSGPTKWCVPNSGLSCPCDAKRDGIVHDCHVKNNFGDCAGKEQCDGMASMWKGCSAPTPVAEACNSKDDDCNGKSDDGDPNLLCSALGPKPPHANYACTSGMCGLGACDPGWAAFPAGMPSAGCTCALEAGEPNGGCATATAAGSVSDAGGAITLKGTLSSANDVDFWSFDTVDSNEVSTNSYHVGIHFTSPMPNTEFQMDVIRGDPCVDNPAGPGTAITDYDWGVNGLLGTTGEAPCGDVVGQAHCADHSAKYYVRVYRKAGVTASCAQYSIAVTAMAGASDLTKQCM